MKEYLQYIRKLIRSSIKPSARKWFWVIVVAAAIYKRDKSLQELA